MILIHGLLKAASMFEELLVISWPPIIMFPDVIEETLKHLLESIYYSPL
jgi:hypothetical protein